jgi:hypothetical protein
VGRSRKKNVDDDRNKERREEREKQGDEVMLDNRMCFASHFLLLLDCYTALLLSSLLVAGSVTTPS